MNVCVSCACGMTSGLYIAVCVCACVRACVCVSECVCVRERERDRVMHLPRRLLEALGLILKASYTRSLRPHTLVAYGLIHS